MNIIYKYVLKEFLLTLLFSLFALCIIFLVVNLLENLDEFLDQKATFIIIAKYYIYYFPEILKILTPIATLVSALFTIGRMSVNNEITAMKSGGFSLYRLMFPLAVLTLVLSVCQLYFSGWIVPLANLHKYEIERKYLNKTDGGGPLYNLYFRDNPRRNIIMQYYNSYDKTGIKVNIEEYTSEISPRIYARFDADKMIWDSVNSVWKLKKVLKREYFEKIVKTSRIDSLNIALNITHSQIMKLKRVPEEMNFDDLKEYFIILKKGGKDTRRQMIDYYGQNAFPFANFIVILFAIPFASIRKKGGIAIQIGAAMIISFTYLLFTKIGQTIGYSSDMNPILAGWMANIIFFIFGIFVMIRTKT